MSAEIRVKLHARLLLMRMSRGGRVVGRYPHLLPPGPFKGLLVALFASILRLRRPWLYRECGPSSYCAGRGPSDHLRLLRVLFYPRHASLTILAKKARSG